MAYDEEKARAWVRAAPRATIFLAVFMCFGAGLCFFCAVGGLLTHEIPVRRALLFALMGFVFLGGLAYQIAMHRWSRRIIESWDKPSAR